MTIQYRCPECGHDKFFVYYETERERPPEAEELMWTGVVVLCAQCEGFAVDAREVAVDLGSRPVED